MSRWATIVILVVILSLLAFLLYIFARDLLFPPGPDDIARAWVKAVLTDKDLNKAITLTCRASRSQITKMAVYKLIVSLVAGKIANFIGSVVEVNVDEVDFLIIRESGEDAIVRANGEIIVSVFDIPVPLNVEGVDIYLVKEKGKWRVCEPQTTP